MGLKKEFLWLLCESLDRWIGDLWKRCYLTLFPHRHAFPSGQIPIVRHKMAKVSNVFLGKSFLMSKVETDFAIFSFLGPNRFWQKRGGEGFLSFFRITIMCERSNILFNFNDFIPINDENVLKYIMLSAFFGVEKINSENICNDGTYYYMHLPHASNYDEYGYNMETCFNYETSMFGD